MQINTPIQVTCKTIKEQAVCSFATLQAVVMVERPDAIGTKSCNGAKLAQGDNTMGCAPGVVWMQNGAAFALSRGFIRTNYSDGGSIYHNETNTDVKSASYDRTSAFSTRCILKSWVE